MKLEVGKFYCDLTCAVWGPLSKYGDNEFCVGGPGYRWNEDGSSMIEDVPALVSEAAKPNFGMLKSGDTDNGIKIRLHCPECGELHVDVGEWETRPHHTHACQHCGAVWRPAVVNTVGVRFLPGFKN